MESVFEEISLGSSDSTESTQETLFDFLSSELETTDSDRGSSPEAFLDVDTSDLVKFVSDSWVSIGVPMSIQQHERGLGNGSKGSKLNKKTTICDQASKSTVHKSNQQARRKHKSASLSSTSIKDSNSQPKLASSTSTSNATQALTLKAKPVTKRVLTEKNNDQQPKEKQRKSNDGDAILKKPVVPGLYQEVNIFCDIDNMYTRQPKTKKIVQRQTTGSKQRPRPSIGYKKHEQQATFSNLLERFKAVKEKTK